MGTINELQNQNKKYQPSKVIILDKHQLTDKSKYAKCIYCWDEKTKAGWDFDKKMTVLQNIEFIHQAEFYKYQNGEERKTFYDYYMCKDCGAVLTVDDYVKKYTKKIKKEDSEK